MRKVTSGERLGCSTLAIGAAAGLVGVRFAGDLSDFRIGVDFRAPTVGGLMPTSSCPNAVCPMIARASNITRRDAMLRAIVLNGETKNWDTSGERSTKSHEITRRERACFLF